MGAKKSDSNQIHLGSGLIIFKGQRPNQEEIQTKTPAQETAPSLESAMRSYEMLATEFGFDALDEARRCENRLYVHDLKLKRLGSGLIESLDEVKNLIHLKDLKGLQNMSAVKRILINLSIKRGRILFYSTLKAGNHLVVPNDIYLVQRRNHHRHYFEPQLAPTAFWAANTENDQKYASLHDASLRGLGLKDDEGLSGFTVGDRIENMSILSDEVEIRVKEAIVRRRGKAGAQGPNSSVLGLEITQMSARDSSRFEYFLSKKSRVYFDTVKFN